MQVFPGELDAKTLRDLAAALRARAEAIECDHPERFVAMRRHLTPEGVERLAEIVAGGSRPTIGFWLRHSRRETAT